MVVVTREGLNLAPTVAKALQISLREAKLNAIFLEKCGNFLMEYDFLEQ
jgi:hypothetical protein